MIYVYLLRDGNGNVIDVGQSQNPVERLYRKTKVKAVLNGKFYGRTDITQEVLSSWPTRKAALVEEGRLKLFYELEWTERTPRPGAGLSPAYSQRKLTIEQANEIRAKYIPRKYSIRKLAKEYKVSQQVIFNIVNNKTYYETTS